jgi:hypothetical protein
MLRSSRVASLTLRYEQWARRCGMFKIHNSAPQVDSLTDLELNDAWKSWARQEEVVRLVVKKGETFGYSIH